MVGDHGFPTSDVKTVTYVKCAAEICIRFVQADGNVIRGRPRFILSASEVRRQQGRAAAEGVALGLTCFRLVVADR